MTGDVLPGGDALLARLHSECAVPDTTRIRLALGYLFVPGLAPLWDALTASPAREIHLLIGNTASVLTDEQRIAAETEVSHATVTGARDTAQLDVAARARIESARIVAETARALRENLRGGSVAPTDENARFLLGLARAAAQGRVRVRVYPEGRLHAKASLFERDGADTASIALVGSSNLTLPEPRLGQATELNIVVGTPDAYRAVDQWFERLWSVSQDFGRDLVTELSQAWPLLPAPPETPTP